MYANISATVVHIVLANILMDVFPENPILAVSIASSAQFMMRHLVTIGYIKLSGKFTDPSYDVAFSDVDSLRHWKSQFIFSLQCMSLSVWSWWAMDVFTIIAAQIPSPNGEVVNAQHIMRTMTLLTFMIPVGIVVSATILVGNNVGANRIAIGKAYAITCVKTAAVWAVATVLLLVLFQDPFIGRYT
jgi:Na+-driven multidrug efflux pump